MARPRRAGGAPPPHHHPAHRPACTFNCESPCCRSASTYESEVVKATQKCGFGLERDRITEPMRATLLSLAPLPYPTGRPPRARRSLRWRCGASDMAAALIFVTGWRITNAGPVDDDRCTAVAPWRLEVAPWRLKPYVVPAPPAAVFDVNHFTSASRSILFSATRSWCC